MAGHVRDAVHSSRRQIGQAVDVCTPAWLRPTEGEPATVALVIARAVDVFK
jgi:hypothetical protein